MAELEQAFGKNRVQCELVQGDNGVFDVTVDGKPVFSKKEAGRFPQYREVVTAIERQILES